MKKYPQDMARKEKYFGRSNKTLIHFYNQKAESGCKTFKKF